MKNFSQILFLSIGIIVLTSCGENNILNPKKNEVTFEQRQHIKIGDATLQITDDGDNEILHITCASNGDGISINSSGARYASIEFGATEYSHGDIFNYSMFNGIGITPSTQFEMTFLENSNIELGYISSSPSDTTFTLSGYLGNENVFSKQIVLPEENAAIGPWIVIIVIIFTPAPDCGITYEKSEEDEKYNITFLDSEGRNQKFDISGLNINSPNIDRLEIAKSTSSSLENKDTEINITTQNVSDFYIYDEIIY